VPLRRPQGQAGRRPRRGGPLADRALECPDHVRRFGEKVRLWLTLYEEGKPYRED
jgi:hypothetical protein